MILHDLSPERLADAIEANTLAYYANFAALPGAVTHTDSLIRWYATGIKQDGLNGVLQAQLQPGHCDVAVAELVAYFQERQLPFQWHVGPSSQPADLGKYLLAHGVAHIEDEPGMAADLQHIDESMPFPAGLTIHPVQDVEMMREWIGVWLFPDGLDAMRADYLAALAGLGFTSDRPLHHYVGRLDGNPVACVALFYAEGVASVQYVVTLSAFRRQGIGAAMTLMALREARAQGYRVAVLTSSPFGYNVYHRLGFRPYITMSTYGWEPN